MYLWAKWLHIIAIISWMAGILYLYRLFINHRERTGNSKEIHELLCGMEYRLYRYITLPAMVVACFAGGFMIFLQPEILASGWMRVKLTAVIVLVWSTLFAGKLARVAAVDYKELPTGKTLRWANELPTILMMIIVGMVVFKAF